MARKSDPLLGVYPIDTGEAEILADDLRPGSYVLNVNGVPSSHVVPDEPRALEFEYMRWIAAVVDQEVEMRLDAARLRVTHLGGAGCSLARYMVDRWPGSRNTVVELDGKLAELVRQVFDLPRAPALKIRQGEAREVTDSFRPESRDVVIRDVFAGAQTPRSLTTVEFYSAVARSLAPGGVYVANCGSHSDLKEMREELAGMREVFPHVAVIADPPMLKGRRYGNVVLVGSAAPLEAGPELTRTLLTGAVPAQFKTLEWALRQASGAHARYDEAVG